MTTTPQIIPDRLEDLTLGFIDLDAGNHSNFTDGHCAMEVVAWLAGEGHTDAPECASPVLRRFTIRCNDNWDDNQRQKLAPYLPRMVGTANDGHDPARSFLALDWLIRVYTPTWLDLRPELTTHAEALRALPEIRTNADTEAAADTVRAAQQAASAARAAAGDAARDAAGAAAWDAARDAAWDAARDAAGDAAWDAAGAAARDAAWDAARDAARTALAPTVEQLQASALELLDRMIQPEAGA
ncbi:hypothetical protein ACFPZL_01105 [Leucobacter soli]|uniref:hypothetical protein n=1 Tax=Leucobacter soli TaxID=2812850 RepID=UPI0036087538